MKYGFIGCGNMGGALATALALTTKDIMLADHNTAKAKALADTLGVTSGNNEDIVNQCERIFLGVKPQIMPDMLSGIAPLLQSKKPLLITMAAGLTTKRIENLAGGHMPVIRIMPNTPVAVGKGTVLYTANDKVDAEVLSDFVTDMEPAGILDACPEHLIDAACSLSGCGPAFMYQFIEALADGAVACGLPRDKAVRYAAATMAGAAEMVLTTCKHPAQLKDEVCSPGGSTIRGVAALEDGGLRAAAMSAVRAAYDRNIELGK
ncbi:MAG: pyrroline-5-carboxylate reductase [Clostridia bacterium]|nr:pyrroline-5-carboxylate reductase [Clostridia bacterium]